MSTFPEYCCFCDQPTGPGDKNIFKDTTNYTNIIFYKIIEEFLDNPIENIENFKHLIGCIECIEKINNYDLAAATFKSAQKDMIKFIEVSEAKFQCLIEKYKTYSNNYVKLENNQEKDILNEPEIKLTECLNEDNFLKNEQNDVLNVLDKYFNEDELIDDDDDDETDSSYEKHIKNLENCEKKYNKSSNSKKSKTGKNFCIPCNMILTTRKDYITHCKTKRHKSIINGTIPYKCEDCGKKLLTETGLKDHITYFHTTERKYLCTICNKHFATGNLLCYHRNRIHPDAFRCPICQKRLISNYLTMEEHIDFVHNNKPVECIECNIKYKNLHSLYQHRKAVHINMRLYQCELCGKKFNENNALKNHIKFTHEKIKNFSCDICNFKTTTKSVLVRHHRIHTGEKKYNCEICGKNYVAKYNLERHIKTLHNIKRNDNGLSAGL